MRRHLSVLTSAALTSIAIAGVFAASGCGSSSKVDARTTTVGKELQDLEDARNKGLLTEDEYNKQRKEIMNRK